MNIDFLCITSKYIRVFVLFVVVVNARSSNRFDESEHLTAAWQSLVTGYDEIMTLAVMPEWL